MHPVLDAREARAAHIKELMDAHPDKTTVILKTNVAGTDKNPPHMRFICAFFNDLMHRTFHRKIQLMGKRNSDDGNYCFYVIDERGAQVKARTIELEESTPLGRLVDLDVYHRTSITRQDLQCEMRKCLLCDNYAHLCARNQTHSADELHAKVKSIVTDFLVDHLTNITIKAIFSELELYPKFGLVSHRDSGCHDDMDYETFIRSTFAIRHDIEDYIRAGLNGDIDANELVAIGKQAERHMFAASGGVNTQKGLIFLLGVFLPTLAEAIYGNHDERQLRQSIAALSDIIVGDHFRTLTEATASTHGDRVYLEYGLKGVRGEAQNGLARIFDMPSWQHFDDDIVHHDYLIHLMSSLDDTTIVHKHDMATLRRVQEQMIDIVNQGGYRYNKERVLKLSEEYKRQGISPGGSADMLVLKIIYDDVRHLLGHKKEEPS